MQTERKCENCCFFVFDTAGVDDKKNCGFCAMKHTYCAKDDRAIDIKCKMHLYREERK